MVTSSEQQSQGRYQKSMLEGFHVFKDDFHEISVLEYGCSVLGDDHSYMCDNDVH
jgi:hypothetical protein